MTIPDIIIRAKISQYLSACSIRRDGLAGGGTPAYLPNLIKQVREDVEDIYNLDPTNDYLVGVANYLYALCGGFGLQASYLINSGRSVQSSTTTTYYSYPITTSYTATSDGETAVTIPLPTGSVVWQVFKSIYQLVPSQYSYSNPTLTLLGGLELATDEVLYVTYVRPV